MIKTNDGKRFKANIQNGQNKSKSNNTQKPSKDKPNPSRPPPAPPQPQVAPSSQPTNMLANNIQTTTTTTNETNTTNSVECDKCGMSFLNANLLELHKEKFCLGPQENDLVNHSNITSNRVSSPPIQSKYIQQQQFVSPRQPLSRISFGSDNNITSNNFNSIKAQSTINQLKSYKNKKSIEQSLKDMEDTLIRDTIRDKKIATSFSSPLPQAPYATPHIISNPNQLGRTSIFSQNQSLNNDPFRELLKEYSEFKKKEKSVLQEIYDYSPDLIPFRTGENNKVIVSDLILKLQKESV